MPRIVPSIASAPMLNLESTLRQLGDEGFLHLDLEDGNFIPNITFGMKTVREICAATKLHLNAHLMVTDPMHYIPELAQCGVEELAVHIESMAYPLQVLNLIRDLGMKPGLAFNFATPIGNAVPFVDACDFFLIMTSEEDGRGQQFHPSSLERIKQARALIGSDKSVWVDGGIGERELPQVCQAGADTVIMGRAVVRAENPRERVSYFSRMC